MSDVDDNVLDPRIQIELEKLNTTTDEINKLELEYDEANTTFRMLLGESTRRLKLLSTKLGNCIERSRPYFEASEVAKKAQQECQRAAVQFQRANEIHAAAKETVALAEHRFLSNQHEWQFDNAWQEMLNHATIKVMEAENQKAECGREHQRRATIFKTAEDEVKQLEAKLQKLILKSRPYFHEKSLCQHQLDTQKERVETIKKDIVKAKLFYAQTLKQLEQISNEIHEKRGILAEDILRGPREPGVGAELVPSPVELSKLASLPDLNAELDRCAGSMTSITSSAMSDKDESESLCEGDLNALKLSDVDIRPIDGGGEGESREVWEPEHRKVAKLDAL